MRIDRWGIGDLMTSAYVLSADEAVIDRQEGTLSPVKGCWPFTSNCNDAKISPSYCALKLKKVWGHILYQHRYSHIFSPTSFVFFVCEGWGFTEQRLQCTCLCLLFFLHKLVEGKAYVLVVKIEGGYTAWCCKQLNNVQIIFRFTLDSTETKPRMIPYYF